MKILKKEQFTAEAWEMLKGIEDGGAMTEEAERQIGWQVQGRAGGSVTVDDVWNVIVSMETPPEQQNITLKRKVLLI